MDEREIESIIDGHFEGLGILKGQGPTQYLTSRPEDTAWVIQVDYKGISETISRKEIADDNGADAKRKLNALASK